MVTHVGPFAVEGELGRGGAGVVLKARAPDGKRVAIKLLKRTEGALLQRFERERRLLAGLGEDAGFVPLLDSGESSAGPWIAMALVPGGSLQDKLARGPLPLREAVALARALARSIGEAHARGLIHRDLKPANVLFAEDGRPLIADLGLAKHYDKHADGASVSMSITRTGTFSGSVGYAAPEQISDTKSVGPASDVFALGAILYECLHGEPAFKGENALQVISRVAKGEHGPLRRTLPSRVKKVIESALKTDPTERPEDGAAFARALAEPRRAPVVAAVVVGVAIPAIAASFIFHKSPQQQAAEWLAQARARTNDPGGTIADLGRAVELDPLLAIAWYERGALEARVGRSADARRDLDRAIALDPRNARAWRDRGVLRASTEPKGALEDYTRAIELAPDFALAYYDRANVHHALGRVESARGDLDRAIALDPRLSKAWHNRGLLRLEAGDRDGALADFTKAVEADPKNVGARINKGSMLNMRGERTKAIEECNAIIETDPRFAPAYYDRGCYRRDDGDSDGALADFERAIDLDPKMAAAWANRGQERIRRGEKEKAFLDLTRAVELDPKFTAALFNRGLLSNELGRQASAKVDFDRVLELDPDFIPALRARAAVRVNSNDLPGAESDLDRAISLDPSYPSAYVTRALVRKMRGNKVGARSDYERARDLDPRGPVGARAREGLQKLDAP